MPEKKSNTNQPELASPKVTLPLPDEKEFRAYLRAEAVRGVQALLESVMKAELEALIGCGWGEVSAERKGYRNGYYHRDLTTSTGAITDLKVPRDRDGHYQTQVFEKYQRHEPEIKEAITEMYVAGASTGKVGGVLETLTGKVLSDSTVSRITSDLEGQFQEWRGRPLQPHYRIFYLDAIRYQVRHNQATDPFVVLAVLAVDLTGKKEVLSLQAYAEETKVGWLSILGEVRERGAAQVDLIVTDGHKGLTVACDESYTATPRQRCLVHKERDIMAAFPGRVEAQIRTELKAIWSQADKAQAREYLAGFRAKYKQEYPNAIASLEDEVEKTLTFYDFPPVLHRYIRTTNAIESMFSQVRDRTDRVDVFTTEKSCLSLVWATAQGIAFQRIPVGLPQS